LRKRAELRLVPPADAYAGASNADAQVALGTVLEWNWSGA
jgi:hypothetical protein